MRWWLTIGLGLLALAWWWHDTTGPLVVPGVKLAARPPESGLGEVSAPQGEAGRAQDAHGERMWPADADPKAQAATKWRLETVPLTWPGSEGYGAWVQQALMTKDPVLALRAARGLDICESLSTPLPRGYEQAAAASVSDRARRSLIDHIEADARRCQTLTPDLRQQGPALWALASDAGLAGAAAGYVMAWRSQEDPKSRGWPEGYREKVWQDALQGEGSSLLLIAWSRANNPQEAQQMAIAQAVLEAPQASRQPTDVATFYGTVQTSIQRKMDEVGLHIDWSAWTKAQAPRQAAPEAVVRQILESAAALNAVPIDRIAVTRPPRAEPR